MPKAGGSTLGVSLSAALPRHTPLAACRLRWNGQAGQRVCARVRRWARRRGAWRAPPLPYGAASFGGANVSHASLEHAAPLELCGLLCPRLGAQAIRRCAASLPHALLPARA